MWTSTVRSSMSSLCGQTVSSSCWREKTRPGFSRKWRSRRYSVGPERDALAVAADAVGGEVHFDPGIVQGFGGEGRADAAQHGAGAGDQFLRAERLGDIIVGAGFEAADAVVLLAARGEHDDRQIGGVGPAAQAAADLDPADPFDHPVEDDQVGLDLVGQDQRFLAVAGARHVVAGAVEVEADQVGKRAVVLDQEQSLGAHRSGLRVHGTIGSAPRGRSAMCWPVAA